MPSGGNHCKCDTCFHTMSAQFMNRIADLERFESLMLLSCITFSLSSLYVRSFKCKKACVTGCHFSLCLIYALITTWVALTGYTIHFSISLFFNPIILYHIADSKMVYLILSIRDSKPSQVDNGGFLATPM